MTDSAHEKAWFDRLMPDGAPSSSMVVSAVRSAIRQGAAALEAPPPELADVRDYAWDGPDGERRARAYTPLACGVAPGPGLLFFHGGGFVAGGLDTHDSLCRRLAAYGRVRVVATDYRLAPEHVFPAAAEDAVAAFDWAVGEGAEALGLDPERVAVGGDSAGGNLAAVVAQERRAPGSAPTLQFLVYPLMQLAETNTDRLKVLEGHFVSARIIENVCETYLAGREQALDPRASPLFCENLSGLPPAIIITAGLDPLQHEACAFRDKLTAAGVDVEHLHYANYPHGFFSMTAAMAPARRYIEDAARVMGGKLGAPVSAR